MKTYTQALLTLNRLTKTLDTDGTGNQSFLADMYNDSIRTVCNIRGGKWWFLESKKTIATVASQMDYYIPATMRKIIDLYVTVGGTIYWPTPVYSQEAWKKILSSNAAESDNTMFYLVTGNKISLYPAPASANTMTITGRNDLRDLSIADYTTGTITTATLGSTAIVGSGTTWTKAMIGRFLRITNSDTANKGDGFWYEIADVPTATTITLTAPYEGISIAAGAAAYTIGQVSPIPEAYDMAPIYRTCALYFQINDPLHPHISQNFWRLYDGGQEAGMTSVVGGLLGQMLENEGARKEDVVISTDIEPGYDPNDYPKNLTGL
jgi:hypothetical protein